MHVEVIRLALGQGAAFAVLKGPGYRKLIVNTDDVPGRPITEMERERGIAEWVRWLNAQQDVPEQRQDSA